MSQGIYYRPKFEEESFHCIHANCGVFARQIWSTRVSALYNQVPTSIPISACRCIHCDQHSIWMAGKPIYPRIISVEEAHTDLPETCKADFEEARNVLSDSPKAAAALLRLCVQKLCIELGGIGRDINADIGAMVKEGLPVPIQKALDVCRVVGNNAVHPGEINLDDSPDIAHKLFRIINTIVQDRITHPREVSELYDELPDGAVAAIEKRDAPKPA